MISLLAIEIDDAGIRATRRHQSGLLTVDEDDAQASPGVAHVDGGAITTGVAAARQQCLHPRTVYDRFWERLDTEPIDARSPDAPNRAEIACVHLQHVLARIRHPDDEIIFAVPATYDERQLGILVGIARELELPVAALVASPVALDPPSAPDRFLVVDVGLHRGSVSVVEGGAVRALGDVRRCPDVSLTALRRQWVKAIGAEFVRKTRFDPLHDATTEQQVHDALPDLLDALAASGSEQLELNAGGRGHCVTVSGQALAHAGHALISGLARDVDIVVGAEAPSCVLLTADAASVPGLGDSLRRQVPIPVHELEPGAAAFGLSRLWPGQFDQSVFGSGSIAYHTRRTIFDATTMA